MKIYYIGNGFDISHDLPTRYKDFKKFFKSHYSENYCKFIELYGLGEMKCDYNGTYYDDSDSDENMRLWMDFENTLAKIDLTFIVDKIANIQEVRDITESQFKDIFEPDPSWYNEVYLQNMNMYKLYEPLQTAFIEWIIDVELNNKPLMPEIQRTPFYPISDKDSLFIVFNYTHLLEKIYNIKKNYIFHPHGEIGNEKNLPKFGHGDKTAFAKIKTVNTYDNDAHYIIDWVERYLIEVEKNVNDYLRDTECFLDNNISFDEEIIINVLGCSFSNVDIPYFLSAFKMFPEAKWNISYHTDEDKCRIDKFISKSGFANNYSLIRV